MKLRLTVNNENFGTTPKDSSLQMFVKPAFRAAYQ